MLIISGTAELMQDYKNLTKGDRHEFKMFSSNMPLEDQLAQIEEYLVSRGWDNIEVSNNGIIENPDDIKHPVLIDAYKKAQKEGLGVTINSQTLI